MNATTPRVRLRVDTWDPERGASYEEDSESKAPVDPEVEGVPWEPIRPRPPERAVRCAFVDGVRRVDVGLFAETESGVAPAIAGAYAVGVAWAPVEPAIRPEATGRLLVVGQSLEYGNLVASIGEHELFYAYRSSTAHRPQEAITALQAAMRHAEAELAARLYREGTAEFILLDGPLNYAALPPGLPILGLVKRQTVIYLKDPELRKVQLGLRVGERTPLFLIGGDVPRYSWYTRIATGRPIDGTLTGTVRMELTASLSKSQAQAIADSITPLLPQFASQQGRDPRAPQNLYPVGQLETVLRHRLGDPLLVRRAIEEALWRQEVG